MQALGRATYVPYQHTSAGINLRSQVEPHSPYPIAESVVDKGVPLLVVVSSAQMLPFVSELAKEHDVVVWAWQCAEVIAQRAEDNHPVVYGIPSIGDVEQAAALPPQRSDKTTRLMRAESVFGIPDTIDWADLE